MAGQNFFIVAANKIQSVEDTSRRSILHECLRQSVGLADGEEEVTVISAMASQIAGPGKIRHETGVSPDQLASYGILLNRKQAVHYLNFRAHLITEEQFRKRSNEAVYDLLFDRAVTRVEGRNVYTYAELAILVRAELKFTLPEKPVESP